MNEVRCDERLKARVEESTCLTYTGRVARRGNEALFVVYYESMKRKLI